MSASRKHMSDLSAALLADEQALRSSLDFGPDVRQGDGDGPAILIGDQTEIPLYKAQSQSRLDYRMTCLAKGSDIVLVRHRDPVFETYIKDALDLPDITFLEAGADPATAVTKQAFLPGVLGTSLARHLAGASGLTIKPYLTKGTAWQLARHLGAVANPPVFVSGPSPRLSRRVNDKLWFADLAQRVVGRDATPPSKSAFGAAAAAGLVCYLAKRASHVVVKVPDSAGSAGNIVLSSADILRVNMRTIRRFLLSRLAAMGWSGRYPILVGVWDENVLCSPSVQMWIPDVKTGPPVIDGIFEQHIETVPAAFVGAAPSRLSPEIKGRLTEEAHKIAVVLQDLGYFGRCSLDAVLFQRTGSQPSIHWIECNGRWGGVSIPMTLARRLNCGSLPGGLVILQERRPTLPEITTAEYIAALDGLLYDGREHKAGIVILSPPQTTQGIMVNLLVMADTQVKADQLAARAIARIETAAPIAAAGIHFEPIAVH